MTIQHACVRNLTYVAPQFVNTTVGNNIRTGDGVHNYIQQKDNSNRLFNQETEKLVALYSQKAKPVLKAKSVSFVAVAAPKLRQLAIA